MTERSDHIAGDRVTESCSRLTRRAFLTLSALAAAQAACRPSLSLFRPSDEILDPFQYYPSRDWERLYRDLYRYDRTFHFLCAPNDTHNCLLKAYVKNNVIVRIGPSFGYGQATDLYGNAASARWDPRCCNKGLALLRRIYGPRRCRQPMVRRGFKEWVERGFPRDAIGRPPRELFQRGKDEWVQVSWEEAFDLAARALVNIAQTYTGERGARWLRAQGYDPAMIEAMKGAGTQTLKFRGGMPLLGTVRIMALYRLANALALLDAKLRNVEPDQALGGRGWDSYSWHTDLPPGHPMVTGQQTVEFDLCDAENARMVICWGMNWISTKMPDAHWLTEARLKGTKIVAVTVEYSSTCSKADEVVIIRPGTDAALALGIAHVLIKEKLYDEEFVKGFTDLPLLVRMDTLQHLKASDIIPNYRPAPLQNNVKIMKPGESAPPPVQQEAQYIPEALRQEWGDFTVWDAKAGKPVVVTRDEVGEQFKKKGIDPALEGEFEVQLVDGRRVRVRPVFDLIKQYIFDTFDPDSVSKLTWAPKEAILNLAREMARFRGRTLVAVGMGPNHFFNNDLKDRAIFLVCALTRNVGVHGGNIGSYAGNYRSALFNGNPQFIAENPFDIELDPAKPARTKSYYKMESAHYFNYGDRPLRIGNKLFTGQTHVPTPTKAMWFANSNSILGNIKWHYDVVVNTLPKVEMIVVQDWWWTASCEYADIVFPVDSWAEFKYPDITASVTNPFLQVFPRTDLPRLHNTRSDIEVCAGVSRRLAELTGDQRFADYWKFVEEGQVEVYLQRILNASTTTRGYRIEELEAKAREGIPALILTRTYPKIMGWEHTNESKPWYTKTGRLEYYRPEPEFLEHGEAIPVYREPVDGTLHEPNVIVVNRPHPAIRPSPPEAYGLSREDLSVEVRQVRNVVRTVDEVVRSRHPLMQRGFTHVYITPKYRHSVHTTPVDTDLMALWFGPFGDPYRRDRRKPWVGEGYVDLNPEDAKALGIEDGDYVWIDGDPEDRPYRGWRAGTEAYKLSRCMLRARYYHGIPPRIARSWFHMYMATYGSVEGHEKNPDHLARNPRTGYQAMFRYGGHQSATRAWLRPTLMTDSLVRKDVFGQTIGKGFAPDIHCTVGAPKESFVKITKAEDGGPEKERLWRPARLGLRPTYESEAMRMFLNGEFVRKR